MARSVMSMSLVERIWNIQQKLGTLQKRGVNETLDYRYLKESHVVEAILEMCKEFRVLLVFESETSETVLNHTLVGRKGQAMTGTLVTLEYDVFNIDNEERLSVIMHKDTKRAGQLLTSQGFSADTGDKSLYKARTGAKKYAILETFLGKSGDDPEVVGASDDEQDRDRKGGNKGNRQPANNGDGTKALPQQVEQFFATRKNRGIPWDVAIAAVGRATQQNLSSNMKPEELRKMLLALPRKAMNAVQENLSRIGERAAT